jgi:hypothetical protein
MSEDEEIVHSVLNESKHLVRSVFGEQQYPPSLQASPLKAKKTPTASPAKSPMKVQKVVRCDSGEFMKEFDNFMVSEYVCMTQKLGSRQAKAIV